MKFLHTADWQIGMKGEFIGHAGKRVRDERLAAGVRGVDAANTGRAEFILVAGDLFEDNAVDRSLVVKTADILARFHGPVYLLPGNHDPLVPGSVWDHPAWRSLENLTILTEKKPVPIPGGVLFPCPVRDKYSRKDPTAWMSSEGGNGIRLGMAHGNVEGLMPADPDHPIARNAASRGGLDYLALGHWHSTATYPDGNGIVKMAYSGTHETTRFGERDSGNALMVEIRHPDSPPEVTPIRTGKLRWQSFEREIRNAGDLKQFRQELEGLTDPGDLLLDLRLQGLLPADDQPELFFLEDLLPSRFLYARLEASNLRPSPEDNRWIDGLPPGVLRETARRLQKMAGSAGEAGEAASRALLELYAISGEGRR
ncbi:MAG: DNA repair exonuclease [Deltaproteobacteria bacterium]|nr:DNA repair exonuclease [Deltaproteobacteria bacterium]